MKKISGKRHFTSKLLYLAPLCVISCALIGILSSRQAVSKETVYNMTGRIRAIDRTANTIVIEVPLETDKLFTVGGPLASNAILRKGDHPVSLADFSPGDEVRVKWKPVESGHLILRVEQ